MAGEADFRLRNPVQNLLIRIVEFMAIGARQPLHLMRAALPQCSRKNLGVVARQAGGVSFRHWRQFLRFGSEYHIRRVVAGILLVIAALAMAPLAAGGARVA